MSLLGVLLLGARSVISPLNLRMVGLEDCIFIDMIKIKVLWSIHMLLDSFSLTVARSTYTQTGSCLACFFSDVLSWSYLQ